MQQKIETLLTLNPASYTVHTLYAQLCASGVEISDAAAHLLASIPDSELTIQESVELVAVTIEDLPALIQYNSTNAPLAGAGELGQIMDELLGRAHTHEGLLDLLKTELSLEPCPQITGVLLALNHEAAISALEHDYTSDVYVASHQILSLRYGGHPYVFTFKNNEEGGVSLDANNQSPSGDIFGTPLWICARPKRP